MALLLGIVPILDLHRWFQFHCPFPRPDNLAHHPDDMQREISKMPGLQNLKFMKTMDMERILNGCVKGRSSEGGDEAEAETVSLRAEVTEAVELRVFEVTVSALLAAVIEEL